MPTRYLKPGIRDSGRIEGLSDCPDAECLFYRLLVTVDDFGRFDARPLVIKANCFPLRIRADADKCIQWLKALESVGLIQVYTVDNKEYLQITNWDNKPRAAESKFPDPPTDVYKCPQMLPVTVTVTGTKTGTKTKPKVQTDFVLPDWIPIEEWDAWIESRKRARKNPTEFAKRKAMEKLKTLQAQGHDPAGVLSQSAFNGWSGLFPIKDDGSISGICNAPSKTMQAVQALENMKHRTG